MDAFHWVTRKSPASLISSHFIGNRYHNIANLTKLLYTTMLCSSPLLRRKEMFPKITVTEIYVATGLRLLRLLRLNKVTLCIYSSF